MIKPSLNSLTFIGEPTLFKNSIYIYPPTVKEVLTTHRFGQFNQALTISQEDIWDMTMGKLRPDGEPVVAPSPFELLLMTAYDSKEKLQLLMDAFKFFTKEEVRIIPKEKEILFAGNITDVKEISDLRILREEDFFDFQNAIRQAIGDTTLEAPAIDEDPRVAKIKAKARERDRIKKKQGSKNGISLTTSMAALCCMGIGINPLNIGEISYASLNLLIKTYQEQEKYRGDVQFLAGGADPKKLKPKYWIRNLND